MARHGEDPHVDTRPGQEPRAVLTQSEVGRRRSFS
jgi:hypothetical protein